MTKFIELILINLVKREAAAELKLLQNKPASSLVTSNDSDKVIPLYA